MSRKQHNPLRRIEVAGLAGIDEAGRGPLAGPVTAACVVLPAGYSNPQVTDSKKLTPRVREILYGEITTCACAYAVVSVGPRRIERLNIREATRLAMKLAAERVEKRFSQNSKQEINQWQRHGQCQRHRQSQELRLLIDGNTPIETVLSQQTIVKGDEKELVIGAASILAKVTRDHLMEVLDKCYPGYGFGSHKGYPTKNHRALIAARGPSRIHRRTFAGVKEYLVG